MVREGYTCPVTKRVDLARYTYDDKPDLLEVARIINQSLSEWIQGGTKEAGQKATTEAVIEQFGGSSARAILGSDNLNSPLNAMLLSPIVCRVFCNLGLWFTPLKVAHLVSALCSVG